MPACEKNRREAVKLGPKSILGARPRVDLRGDRRSNAKLCRAPVLCNVQIPRQRTADRWIVPNSELSQGAHGRFFAILFHRRRKCPLAKRSDRRLLHAIFTGVVLAKNLANLLSKALVTGRLRHIAVPFRLRSGVFRRFVHGPNAVM